jgi:hypothetical protein
MGGRWTHDAISKTDATEFGFVCGGVFSAILSHFCPFWSISAIFGSGFSLFCPFSNLPIRYTRAEDGTLMYSPSPTRVKAPQLGPKGCRILRSCPACGFRIKALISLGPIVFEYAWDSHGGVGTHRTHRKVLASVGKDLVGNGSAEVPKIACGNSGLRPVAISKERVRTNEIACECHRSLV